jgi:sugar lactone lactonase YvrE
MRVEQVTGVVAYHAEGPVSWPGWGGLRWVDMLAGDVLALASDGSIERRHVGEIAAALRPRQGGGAVIGIERGFALEDADAGLTDRRVLAALEYRHDGLTVDAEGGVWTALSDGEAVRRYTPEGELDAVIRSRRAR